MNLVDAIKSGKRFRRLELNILPHKWWPSDDSWVDPSDVVDWFRTISLEDLLADDWEVDSK